MERNNFFCFEHYCVRALRRFRQGYDLGKRKCNENGADVQGVQSVSNVLQRGVGRCGYKKNARDIVREEITDT